MSKKKNQCDVTDAMPTCLDLKTIKLKGQIC